MQFEVKEIKSENTPVKQNVQREEIVRLPSLPNDEAAVNIEDEFFMKEEDIPEIKEKEPEPEVFKGSCTKKCGVFGNIKPRETSGSVTSSSGNRIKYGIYGLMLVALLSKVF